MLTSSEGVRRLSIFAGGIGSFLWVVWFLQNERIDVDEPLWWLLIIVASVGSFLVGFALIRAIAWVISGFFKRGLVGKLDGVSCKEAADVQYEACGSWLNVIDKTNECIANSERVVADAMTNIYDNICTKGKEELIEHQRQREAWLKGIVDYAEENLRIQQYWAITKLRNTYQHGPKEKLGKDIGKLEEEALSLGVDLKSVVGYKKHHKE